MEEVFSRIYYISDGQGLSRIANAAIKFSSLAETLALENRKLVNHRDGRAENVAEHTFNLLIIAPEIAQLIYPDLDRNQILRFVRVHDVLEAYTGDVDTHDFASVNTSLKEEQERDALIQLKSDFAEYPEFVMDVEDYEEQKKAEARFVRVLDKIMPLLMHVHDGGATLKSYTNSDNLRTKASPRNEFLLREYPEFSAVVALRQELTKHAATLI